METACVIDKADLPGYTFIKHDVLNSPSEREKRKSDIQKALLLGNNEHQKVKIYFETTAGRLMVETTVWEVTQNYVILKSNTHLPVNCIHRIDFFE